jgi:hypothetical protein
MFWKKSKKSKRIKECCGNCLLFNKEKSECRVVILHEGQKYNVPVDPSDSCFFGNKFVSNNEEFTMTEEIKEIKMWVEDKDGKRTDGNGIVKIEYPKNPD